MILGMSVGAFTIFITLVAIAYSVTPRGHRKLMSILIQIKTLRLRQNMLRGTQAPLRKDPVRF